MQNEHIVFSNDKFSIYVSGALLPGKAEDQTNKVVDQHFHEEYEFLYCQRDHIDFVVENITYRLCSGDVIFVNSLVPHKTIAYDDTSYLLVQFKSPYAISGTLRYLSRIISTTDNQCYIFKDGDRVTEEIRNCMVSMVREDANKENSYEYYLSAIMHMIMAILYRNKVISDDAEVVNSQKIKKLLPVIEYVGENYDKPISVSDAAAVLNIDKAYFCRLFKKTCSCTFTEYLNFVRVCEAELMLKKGESISGTAYGVGFSSQSYFNRIFKKYKLCTPSEYKNICMRHKN